MKYFIFFTALLLLGCSADTTSDIKQSEDLYSPQDTVRKDYVQILTEKEKTYSQKLRPDLGEQIGAIVFCVKTTDKDFEDGVIPWVSIANPDEELKNLIGKNDLVIKESKVIITIDYPLTNPCIFDLESAAGFTRAQLLTEISKKYNEIYADEEKSASVKTVPEDKREIHNRNETNGKYGIWGHDITDLALSEILVYKTSSGQLKLTLTIES